MTAPVLALQNVGFELGGSPVIERADLALAARERLTLVGRNGSGKSSLLKIAAGERDLDRGVRFQQPGTTLRYLPQEPDVSGFETTLAFVEAGLGPMSDPGRPRALLDRLGLSPDAHPARLSGGEARRAALARALAPDPDILLLDEPTNHLDVVAIEWLEAELRAMRSALVIVSHDRRFLEALSTATIWLDGGVTRRMDRPFDVFDAWRDQILEEDDRDRRKLERKAAAEEHWASRGVTARRKRNVRRLAELKELRRTLRDAKRATGDLVLATAGADRSGSLVIEADRISKSYGEQAVVRDFSIRIMRKDRIGLVGPNGAGKTTLLKLLIGELAPDSGRVRLGEKVTPATLDQGRSALRDDKTLAEALTGGGSDVIEIGGERKHVVGYMKDFLFTPEQARTPISRLSGGERARLALARALALPSNLLVLDEPTNDLDMETLDVLQEMIADYGGPVLVVSHDRDFIDRVATSVLVAEGDGRWVEYAGGYTDMVAQRGHGFEGAGATPVRRRPKGEPGAASAKPMPATRRLSFNEKYALDSLPGRIASLERQKGDLRRALEDETLYARDPNLFSATSASYARVEADLAAAEDEWLALEMRREELEGS